MKEIIHDGRTYRLPGSLSSFQEQLYIHLIDWKRKHITTEAGSNLYRGRRIPYDAILPERMADEIRMIYPPIRERLRAHHYRNPFRKHNFFNHMASSQAAAVNLFLPILGNPAPHAVLKQLKPDFASLATDHLDGGFCFEFWGGNFDDNIPTSGPLGDKSAARGTDCDIAIAYRNPAGELCLWLIEHKLCEREFTCCSGPKSNDRDPDRHDCASNFPGILQNQNLCFHHDFSKRKYWDITNRNSALFSGFEIDEPCPFRGGMNQLWRNLLLALALEQDQDQPYSHGFFSVVKHPANPHLDETLMNFKMMIGCNSRFTDFTSEDLLEAAGAVNDEGLIEWADWYRQLYML